MTGRSLSKHNTTTRTVMTDRRDRYCGFFRSLDEGLGSAIASEGGSRGLTRTRFMTSAGYRGIYYQAAFRQDGVAVELYVDTTSRNVNALIFDGLLTRRNLIELGIGESLRWERLDNRRACRIASILPGSIDDDHLTSDDTQGWMAIRLKDFRRVFEPFLREVA